MYVCIYLYAISITLYFGLSYLESHSRVIECIEKHFWCASFSVYRCTGKHNTTEIISHVCYIEIYIYSHTYIYIYIRYVTNVCLCFKLQLFNARSDKRWCSIIKLLKRVYWFCVLFGFFSLKVIYWCLTWEIGRKGP